MKNLKFIFLLGGTIFTINSANCEPLNLTNVIRYIPLTNYVCENLGNDDGHFGVNMGGLEYAPDNQCGAVVFQLTLACSYIGDGKVIKFLPAKPTDLKECLENEYKGQLPNLTPVVIGKLHGLTTVSLTATRPSGSPAFFQFYWIQLETNIVVKVSVVSCDAENFRALTNSLQSLKIDEKKILKSLSVAKLQAD